MNGCQASEFRVYEAASTSWAAEQKISDIRSTKCLVLALIYMHITYQRTQVMVPHYSLVADSNISLCQNARNALFLMKIVGIIIEKHAIAWQCGFLFPDDRQSKPPHALSQPLKCCRSCCPETGVILSVSRHKDVVYPGLSKSIRSTFSWSRISGKLSDILVRL